MPTARKTAAPAVGPNYLERFRDAGGDLHLKRRDAERTQPDPERRLQCFVRLLDLSGRLHSAAILGRRRILDYYVI